MIKHKALTLGSLFDGSGGFPLGGLISGITPVWASEIEPFPILVTTKRLPTVKHYGDISQMDGGKIEPVDIITFGSPCTDMSCAGKRAGLNGPQSSLFYEAIRIIREMREATNGKYPRYCVWENVVGAYSSNGGKDFKAVLEAVIGVVEPGTEVPAPEKNRWPYADCYVGDGWSVAYRTFDAQHWGVPQRRRRIYLVADFAGECAGKILFESEGLSGYSAESFRAWQRAAGSAENCIGATGGICLNDQGGTWMDVSEEVSCTLRAENHGHPPLVLETHPMDGRIKIDESGVVQTLSSRMGTGGMNVPLLLKARSGCEGGGKGAPIQEDESATLSCNNDQTLFQPVCFGIGSAHNYIYVTDISRTIDTKGGNPSCNQGGIVVVESYAIPDDVINEGVSFTLNTVDRHAVYSTSIGGYDQALEEKAPALMARDYKGPTVINQGYSVRSLTPTECARLQGFPDWWCADLGTEHPTEDEITFWSEVWETHRRVVGGSTKPKSRNQIIKWLKNPHSDSAEYKMWGNGVALPCVFFVLAGIVWSTQISSE